jgi:VIT1/CCC1 family predicted Fe2+/Mn2+ transporter
MDHSRAGDQALVGALKDILSDASDLFRKEIRLARAEVARSLSNGLQAGIWMAAAGVIGFVAMLVLIQALIFGIASLGLGLGWASLIVAVLLAAAAAGAFFYGRSLTSRVQAPKRVVKQVNQDVTAVREQFT